MTKKLRYLCTLLLMAVVGVAWADQESVTFADEGYTNGQEVASYTGTNFSIAFNKGTNSNAPKYYTTGSAIRAYGGNNFTVSSDNTITAITITFASGEGSNAITTDVETYSNGTWSGSANSVTFTVGGTTGHRRIAGISVTYTASGSSTTLEDNDLALTNAPVALTFDLYNNANPQVISYTTSSTGAVTIAASDFYETEIDETNKTITVTPLAVTNGEKEVTVSQAADETYKSGSATFAVNITDSTPFEGGDVTFDATVDKGASPLLKNGITFECDNGVLNNGSEYRLYKNSSTTFTTSQGVITKIVFTGVSGNPASGFAAQNGFTTDGSNGTWEGSAESVTFTASGAQVRATKIVVTVDLNAVPDPAIEADDVNIAYDATQGAITYTITNEVDGGNLTATTQADWITIGTVGKTVPFTATANEAAAAREATVTLTYSYGDNQTVTKDVTVTQAAAPVIYTTIPALFEAATSTAAEVNVTFDNWVVSGVSSNTAFVTDGTNGFVIYGNNHGFVVGNTLTSTSAITCNLQLRNGYAQITNITSATEGLTVGTGGTVEAANIAMADLAGVNTGALVSYENLTCSISNNRYYLSDGTTTIQVYTTLYSDLANSLEDGKIYNITGIYQQYNTTKEILPRDANDIVEVVSVEPAVTLENYNIDVPVEGGDGILTVQYQNIDDVIADIQFYDATGAEVDANEYANWLTAELDEDNNVNYTAIENNGEERKAYFKVYALVGDNSVYSEVYSDMITITQAAYVPKWIVSFDTDGGTFVPNDDFAEEIVEVEQGTHYLPSATKDGYRLDGWNDGDATYAAGCGYDVTGDVEFTAVWVEKGVEEWVKTDISELEEGDVFVIVGNNGSDYAMTNDNGASAPLPVAVTVEEDKITSEVAENIQWNIANGTNGYIFYPNGSTTTFLYCIDNNNGLRVGAGSGTYSNTFELDESGYLKTNVNNKDRFVGIYTASNASAPQDWRCYTNTTGNIANQTFAFYKKVETYPASTVKLTIRDNFTATTFSSDKALDFSGFETLKAYIITDGEGTTTQVWKVPAGEGLYVEGEAGDYDVPILVNETEAEEITGNLLVGTISEPVNTKTLKGDYTYYLFGKQNGKEAFFKVGESTSDAKATASAGKAYLAVPGAGNAKEMIVIGGDVTGIESIENGTIVNDNYYTIDGKLVKGQPTQKGIYVVNGRKVVIK